MRGTRQRYVLLTLVALAIASTLAVVGCGPGGVPGTTASVPSSNTSASSSPTSAPTTTADTTTGRGGCELPAHRLCGHANRS